MSVSAIVVAHGRTPDLTTCVERLLASVKVDVEVILVDNGCTDGSVAAAAAGSERVRVVDAGANLGFGGGCNRGVDASDREVVAFVNPDVVVEPDALFHLVGELSASEDVGMASAAVRLQREPELMNSVGGSIHFLGLGWAEGFRQPASSPLATQPRDVVAVSGACMAMRRSRFAELGGFTEELFMYHEDAELSLRCWQRGWTVRYVPDAVVHHDYEFGRNPGKLGLLERNRLVLVLTCYSARLLGLLAPALVLYEGGVFALSIAQGWSREKVRGWVWLARHARWLRNRRREVQAARRRSDRELAPLLSARFTGGQVALPAALAPGDQLLGAYWRLVSRWL